MSRGGDRYMENVQVLNGAEGIKTAYEKTLNAHALDIVCLSCTYASVVGDYFDREYAPKLFREKIGTREILPDTAANRADAKKKDGVKNQVRFINKNIPSESDYMLFGDTAIFVSYDLNNPFAILIQNREIVANLKSQFEALWRGLTG
jgi:hypothetical protein